jgi:tRNA threonylcarbamoyladenosine biosynthesis protein TsaB
VKPLVLAVDTTHEFGSLALARGEALLDQTEIHAPGGFAHVLYEHLQCLLSRHRIRWDAIDCFAAASGPGSFTGVRVGLACIKGLAEACARPALAVSNLAALASCGSGVLRAAVMDARRGEIYGAVYDAEGRIVVQETVVPFRSWLDTLPERSLEFVSPDADAVRIALQGTRFAGAPVTAAPRALAPAIACIATAGFLRGEALDPAALDANYVRRSDAELHWKE